MSAADPDPADLFRIATDAIVKGDLDDAMSLLADDVVLDWSRSRGPLQGVHRGHSGARQYWEDMYEAWEPVSWELEVVDRPAPDTVVLASAPQARGRGSGIEMGGRGGLVVQVREGKIARVTLFQSPEEAQAATISKG